MPLAPGGHASGGHTLGRGEVPKLRAIPQDAQVVRYGVHQAPLGQPLQPVSERGGRKAAKAGQLLHGGQGRGAQQQERLLKAPAQVTEGRDPAAGPPGR